LQGYRSFPIRDGLAHLGSVVEFPMPDTKTKRHIFKLHTSRMSLAEDVDLEELIMTKDDLSGADIKAVCSESSGTLFEDYAARSLQPGD